MCFSPISRTVWQPAALQLLAQLGRQRRRQGALDCFLLQCDGPTRAVGAEIRATAVCLARGVKGDDTVRRPDDADEFALLPLSAAGNAGSGWVMARRQCLARAGCCGHHESPPASAATGVFARLAR